MSSLRGKDEESREEVRVIVTEKHEAKEEMKPDVISITRSSSCTTGSSETKLHLGSWKALLPNNRCIEYLAARSNRNEHLDERNVSEQSGSWKTSFLRFGPLSGIFCMLLAAAALVASLGILAGSDGQSAESWVAPPSTYLAIFTAIANLSIRYAAVQGAAVAWWTRALSGSTLAQLHWDWSAGNSLKGALTAGRFTSLLGLACIMSTLIVIDGPLLQRASTVVEAPSVPIHVQVNMVPELPSGLTGAWESSEKEGSGRSRFSPLWNDTIPTTHGPIPNNIWPTISSKPTELSVGRWLDNQALAGVVQGCPKSSVCKITLRAPALWPVSCSNNSLELDFETNIRADRILQKLEAPPMNHNVFFIDSSLDVSGEDEAINLVTGFTTTNELCNRSVLNWKVCTLKSAIGEYDATVQGQRVLVDTMSTPRLVRLAHNAAVNHTFDFNMQGHPSTLAGIVFSMVFQWDSLLTLYLADHDHRGIESGAATFEEYYVPGPQKCPTYRDPHEDILQSYNRLMFYMGSYAASQYDATFLNSHINTDLPVNYNATGTTQDTHSVFNTNYWFFAGAAVVDIICIFLILPTYWNWWKLGRAVSFSPLEIAKAFEAPMLSENNSNSSGRDLANTTEEVKVKYGLVASSGSSEPRRMGFANATMVTTPSEGTRIDI